MQVVIYHYTFIVVSLKKSLSSQTKLHKRLILKSVRLNLCYYKGCGVGMGIGLVSFTKGRTAKQSGLWLLTPCVKHHTFFCLNVMHFSKVFREITNVAVSAASTLVK